MGFSFNGAWILKYKSIMKVGVIVFNRVPK